VDRHVSSTVVVEPNVAHLGTMPQGASPGSTELPAGQWALTVLYVVVGLLLMTALLLSRVFAGRIRSRRGAGTVTGSEPPSSTPLRRSADAPAGTPEDAPAGARAGTSTRPPRRGPLHRPAAAQRKNASAAGGPPDRDTSSDDPDRLHAQRVVVMPSWQPVESASGPTADQAGASENPRRDTTGRMSRVRPATAAGPGFP
jgi:hypothetical protein